MFYEFHSYTLTKNKNLNFYIIFVYKILQIKYISNIHKFDVLFI